MRIFECRQYGQVDRDAAPEKTATDAPRPGRSQRPPDAEIDERRKDEEGDESAARLVIEEQRKQKKCQDPAPPRPGAEGIDRQQDQEKEQKGPADEAQGILRVEGQDGEDSSGIEGRHPLRIPS